jgi:histidinol-phosphate aminotransferase
MDLTWTGNQFLDRAQHRDLFLAVVQSLDITTKDDTWGKQLARETADHFGLRPEWVRAGAGATQLIDVLLRARYRGMVVDVTPNFHLTRTICEQEGWGYVAVPVREPGDLMRSLEPYLDREDVIISLSSPRNPLGYQFGLADLAAVLDRSPGTILLDEVYADFASDSGLRLVGEYPNLIVVRTFSKAWGLANLRVGFAASALLGQPGFALPLLPNSIAGVAQREARYLLANPAQVRASIERARTARDQMTAALAEVPRLHVWRSDANYICVETPHAGPIARTLDAAGYSVRKLHDLRNYPEGWPAGLRITVPPPPHADAVTECIRATATGLAGAGLAGAPRAAGASAAPHD